jgi:hypothetical protein
MPFIGSAPNKTFQRTDGTRTGSEVWQEAKAAAVKIRADAHDVHDEDVGDALSALWLRDGGNQPTADLPMDGHKFTGVGNAAARDQFAAAGQIQDASLIFASAAGTGDALTLDLTPSITAYATGAIFAFKATATNTGSATINIDGVGAKTFKKGAAGSTNLGAGDITSGGCYLCQYDGTNMQLLNPGLARNVSAFMATVLDDASASAARSTLSVPGLTVVNEFEPGASNANTDWLILKPTDYASNKPYFAIKKGSAAETYQIILWDGSDNGGTIDFACTTLSHNSASVLTTANPTINPGALIAILEDQKSSGTSGGSFASGADRTRTLNTAVFNRGSTVSLSSNQFTLPAGSWEIDWSAPGFNVDNHQSMLYDVTAGSVIARGSSEISELAEQDVFTTRSVGNYRVTPSGSNAYEIRHRCQSTDSDGFGPAASFGTEVYTRVVIRAA